MPAAMPITSFLLSWIQLPISLAVEEPLHWPYGGISDESLYMCEDVVLTLLHFPPPPQVVPSRKFCCML